MFIVQPQYRVAHTETQPAAWAASPDSVRAIHCHSHAVSFLEGPWFGLGCCSYWRIRWKAVKECGTVNDAIRQAHVNACKVCENGPSSLHPQFCAGFSCNVNSTGADARPRRFTDAAKVPRLVVDETTSTANPFVDGRICHSLTAATATATAAAAAATAAATAVRVVASNIIVRKNRYICEDNKCYGRPKTTFREAGASSCSIWHENSTTRRPREEGKPTHLHSCKFCMCVRQGIEKKRGE